MWYYIYAVSSCPTKVSGATQLTQGFRPHRSRAPAVSRSCAGVHAWAKPAEVSTAPQQGLSGSAAWSAFACAKRELVLSE